jgi:hypothetical protein
MANRSRAFAGGIAATASGLFADLLIIELARRNDQDRSEGA